MSAVEQVEYVVCVSSHMAGENAIVVNEGTVKRANDPLVIAAPGMYRPKGTPPSEFPSVFDTAIAVNDAKSRADVEATKAAREKAAKENVVTFEAPQFVTAKRDIICELDGRPATVRKGSKLPSDHPVAVEFEADFSA